MNQAFWRGKRVLVTGHTGFKGSWLCAWLARAGAAVHGFALQPDTSPNLFEAAQIGDVVESRTGDIRDADAVGAFVAQADPEIVFHLAAQPLVRESYMRPLYTYAVNAMGTANLLESLRNARGVRAVICVTTDKCYENREWVWPYRESDALGGYDPYSSSKACAEIIAAAYRSSFFSHTGAAGVATARGGNVIGGGDWSRDRIVPDLVSAFAAGEPGIVRNPRSIRPWQYILDALHGYILLAERVYDEPAVYAQAWNFAPDASGERRVGDLADRFTRAWGEATWRHVAPPDAPHEAAVLKLDSSKARTLLGWRDVIPIDEAVDRIARWYTRFSAGAQARDLMNEDFTDFEQRLELPV